MRTVVTKAWRISSLVVQLFVIRKQVWDFWSVDASALHATVLAGTITVDESQLVRLQTLPARAPRVVRLILHCKSQFCLSSPNLMGNGSVEFGGMLASVGFLSFVCVRIVVG